MDIANAWRIAKPEQRHRVQNLLFEGGLDYSPNLGILNRSNSSLFSVLEAMNSENGLLVGPEGFEPPDAKRGAIFLVGPEGLEPPTKAL
jgi:hypothetical protein